MFSERYLTALLLSQYLALQLFYIQAKSISLQSFSSSLAIHVKFVARDQLRNRLHIQCIFEAQKQYNSQAWIPLDIKMI
jgi:hypothetical protein